MFHLQTFITILVVSSAFGWENLAQVPSGKRSEYFVVKDNGGYEYGYDSGIGAFAKQSGTNNNEVDGHFAYPSADGQQVDIKYTAGVNGYVPYTVGAASTSNQHSNIASYNYATAANAVSSPISPVYSYSYRTVHDTKPATANLYGGHNVASTTKNAGFSYNIQTDHPSLTVKETPSAWTVRSQQQDEQHSSGDASYQFDYQTGDASRKEVSDASGNVHGHYTYTNEAGQHDLHYVAGADTGFQVTGGSLAAAGAATQTASSIPSSSSTWQTKSFDTPVVVYNVEPNTNAVGSGDASYNFAYNVGDSARQEVAEQDGSVQGKYSYTNEAGQHDLHYKAGAGIGFVVTGGSLAVPNGNNGESGAVRQTGWSSSVPQHQQTVANDAWNVEVPQAPLVRQHQHRSQSENGLYQLNYQVGSGLERNGNSHQYSVTKLLPGGGNAKYGYTFESY